MKQINLLTLLTTGLMLFSLNGCGLDDHTPEEQIYTCKDAENRLHHSDQAQLPNPLNDLWVFDGGSFDGSIYYVSFTCETIDDCWQAVSAFGAPDADLFLTGIQTQYAVNQHGPSFYFKDLTHPEWDVAGLTNAVSYETAQGTDKMEFWAIDLDNLRVFYHYESGGFPDDPPTERYH